MAADRIRVEVTGESGDLQAALRRSRDSIRGVGDESDRQTTRAGRHFDRLRAKLRRPIQAKVETDTAGLQKLAAELKKIDATKVRAEAGVNVKGAAQLKALHSQVRSFGRESASASAGVNQLGGSVARTNQSFTLLRNGIRLLKWPALIAALGTAIQMFSALGAGAIALTSALAPLSGVLAAYPGFLAAIAQGMSVWKLATGGLKEALGGLNEKLDTESEAFKKLSPAAQDFARYLQQLKPHIRGLQRTAQEGLFPGLREGLHEAMKNFPVVERLVGRTARALGGLAASAGKALGSAEWGRDMETIGNANVVILTRLGKAAGNVANAFRHIWVAAAPTLKKLAGDVTNVTQKFEEAAAAGRKSGGLANFFERARQKLHQVSRIVADVAVGLGNVFKAGSPTGNRLLTSLEQVADRWREWTGSVQGQNHLRRYFQQAEPGIRQMGGLLADVTKMFLRLGASKGLAPLIAQIRRDLLPAVESLIKTFTTTVGPAFVNLATQLARLFAALAPHIAAVVKVIADIAAAIASVVRQVPGIGTMTAGVMALGVAFKALKLTGIITGLKVILGTLGKFRGAGAAAAGALGGIAGRNAVIAKGGAKAGAGWATAFKTAIKRAGAAGVVITVATGLVRDAPKVAAAGKKIGDEFNRSFGSGIKEFIMQAGGGLNPAMQQLNAAAAKGAASMRKFGPAIRNAIRTNDVAGLKRLQGELGKLGPEAKKAAERVRSALKNAATGNDATWKRMAKGMSAIPKAGEGAVGRLLRVFRRLPQVRKLVFKTDDKQAVVTVAKLAGRLRNLGRTRTVAKILAT